LFDSVLAKVAESTKEVYSLEDLDPTIAADIDNEVKEFM
jgi:hypothetical protein